jgi:oxygen-independent coproporphyrinogen-3 oxidase
MVLYSEDFDAFDSIYVGGGTPSLLDTDELGARVGALNHHFVFPSGLEFTMEMNPDDVTKDKLTVMRGLGVNRISLGIQSFNDRELAFLKRRHDSAGAEHAIRETKAGGFTNIGLDLIYGLPGQTKAGWAETLQRAVSFEPSHLSCYQLTVEGHTPLGTMVESNAVRLPDDERGRQLFLFTSQFLQSHGFLHYEISNFAAASHRVCQHNRKYWRHVAYLGLGPAAHSFNGHRRWWNHRSVSDYCMAIEQGKPPMEGMEELTAEQLALEHLYLGLRTSDGISTVELSDHSKPAIRQLRKTGLIHLDHGRIKLTTKGYLVADSLPVLLSE